MTKSRRELEDDLKKHSAVLISRDKYKKSKETSGVKRILMNVVPMGRAKNRMAKYENFYNEVVENVESAKEVEKQLQSDNLSSTDRRDLKAERDEYIDNADGYGHIMAKKVVKGLKDEGYYSRARVDSFLKNHPKVKRTYTNWLKARGKKSKQIKLNKSVLLRIVSKLSRKARADERLTREVHKDYVEDMVDNVVDVSRNGKMLYNPEAIDMLAPKNIRNTLEKVKDVDYEKEVPYLKPVNLDNTVVPKPPVAPTETSNSRDFVVGLGKKIIEENDTKAKVEALTEQLGKLTGEVQRLTAENETLRNENISLKAGTYTPVAPAATAPVDFESLFNSNSSSYTKK